MSLQSIKPKVKNLRTGRVYLITPDPTPGFSKKIRPALYIGHKQINESRRYLFIQIGSSKPNLKNILDLKNETKYFWNVFKKECDFHIDVSKYEYIRVVHKPYKQNGTFVELKHDHLNKLKKIYFNRISELENIRLIKAKKYAILGDFPKAIKQLRLLKIIMPEKHKKLHPESLVKNWKHAFDSFK